MKNASVLIIVTVVAVLGYYVGTATAHGHKKAEFDDRAVVLSEEELVVSEPQELLTESVADKSDKALQKAEEKADDASSSLEENHDVNNFEKHIQKGKDWIEKTW